jgi:O-antigen/teichoic acid export membrane protein
MSTLRRQGTWAVADQVLSSGTNFVPAILLARVLGPAGFGAFSLAFLAWFGTLQFLRSALMQPYTLAAAPLEGVEWRDITSRASGAVVVGGVTVGGVFAFAAVVVDTSSRLGHAFLAIAVLAPGMALQEFWRVASFAAQRARTATANDSFWAISQVAAFAIVLTRGRVTVEGGLFAWGVGAWVGAGLGMLQLSVVPRIDRTAIRWARKWSVVGAWFTITSTTYSVGLLVVAIIIAAKSGSSGVGLFRAVQNLFGPVQLLTIGAEMVFVPHLVRAIKRTGTNGLRQARFYSLLMMGAVTVYGVVLLLGARIVLTDAFGAAFAPAAVIVLPTLLAFVLDAANSGAALQLRAHAKGGKLATAQLAATLTRLAAVALLASIGGLREAVWGLVIGSGVGALTCWYLAYPHDRPRRHSAASVGTHDRLTPTNRLRIASSVFRTETSLRSRIHRSKEEALTDG